MTLDELTSDAFKIEILAKDELRYVAFTVWIVPVVPIKLFAVAVEKLPVELLIVFATTLEAFTLTGLNNVVVRFAILALVALRFSTLIELTDTVVVV